MGSVADKLSYLKETKNQIKNAIIQMGQDVSDTDTFRNYSEKISNISSDADATEKQILEGKTAYVNGEKITGKIKTIDTLTIGSSVGFRYSYRYNPSTNLIYAYDYLNFTGYPRFRSLLWFYKWFCNSSCIF